MSRKPVTHAGLPEGLAKLGDWHISEYRCDGQELTVRGKFELPPIAALDEEQMSFLITFLRCRGVLSSVEKELGISYPTVRARLDALLDALDLTPMTENGQPRKAGVSDKQKEVLRDLEEGKLTPEEAKKALRETGQ